MTYEQKDNTGSIFRNERKTTDQHPGGTGSCLIDGVAYYVDAWTNEGPKGKYQSLKFKRKDKPAEQRPSTSGDSDFDLPPF